jgi:hypothetical protein
MKSMYTKNTAPKAKLTFFKIAQNKILELPFTPSDLKSPK